MYNEITMFENRLVVYDGLCRITINGNVGYSKRIFKKFGKTDLSHSEIENYILNMYKHRYSYTHIVNHCIAIDILLSSA